MVPSAIGGPSVLTTHQTRPAVPNERITVAEQTTHLEMNDFGLIVTLAHCYVWKHIYMLDVCMQIESFLIPCTKH